MWRTGQPHIKPMQDVKKEMTKRRIYTVLGNLLYTGIYAHSNWVPSRNLLVQTPGIITFGILPVDVPNIGRMLNM